MGLGWIMKEMQMNKALVTAPIILAATARARGESTSPPAEPPPKAALAPELATEEAMAEQLSDRLDDDGMSEFVVGEASSGMSRSYTRVSVLDIAVPPKEGAATEVRFRHDAENLSPDEVRIEAIGPKGHYCLRIKDTSFHLVNGQDVRKPKPKQAPAEPTVTPK